MQANRKVLKSNAERRVGRNALARPGACGEHGLGPDVLGQRAHRELSEEHKDKVGRVIEGAEAHAVEDRGGEPQRAANRAPPLAAQLV